MPATRSIGYRVSRAIVIGCFLWANLLPAYTVFAQKREPRPLDEEVRQFMVDARANGFDENENPDRDVLRNLSGGLHKIWGRSARNAEPVEGVRLAVTVLETAGLKNGHAKHEVELELLKRILRRYWSKMASEADPVEGMQAMAQILEPCSSLKGSVLNDIQADLLNKLLRESWGRFAAKAEPKEALRTAVAVWKARGELSGREQDHLARDMFAGVIEKLANAATAADGDFLGSLTLAKQHSALIPEDVNRNVALDVVRRATTAQARLFQKEQSWCRQDGVDLGGHDLKREEVVTVLEKVLAEVPDDVAAGLRKRMAALPENGREAWAASYLAACEARRRARLSALVKDGPLRFVFTQHWNIGGQHFAYTENLSTAHGWRTWTPGGGLYLYTLRPDLTEEVELLLDAGEDGCIRDPDVHWDGQKILFAWKKSDREDDYHLYEMDLATRKVRQLTFGLGDADYEGIYLPGDNILFTSTRCVQVIDCFTTDVSNFYICSNDGRYLRRISFDQVTVNYPQVLNDGRVVYTRWEYNDRGQIYPQALFVMNADGTGQTEYYGNNSYFPNTIGHARPIPDSTKVIAIASGHHSHQVGGLIRIDVAEGRQEDEGCTYVAPVERKAPRFDAPPEHGGFYTHPYALNEKEYIAGYSTYMRPSYNTITGFGIYYVREDGAREQLVYDPDISSSQPVLLKKRKRPTVMSSTVDYTKDHGTYYVQDVYHGPGMAGIQRGTAKRIRVVQPLWRTSKIGGSGNGGPAGRAFVCTPIGVRNAAWDPKVILGESPIEADGSAYFRVPARRPVYFQVLDERGHVIQTMRSWSTLMPGESFSCVGCHEDKNTAPLPDRGLSLAATQAAKDLEPFWGPARGFSFAAEVQPVLDRHCIKCHDGREKTDDGKIIFSLLSTPVRDDRAKRVWTESYVNLTINGEVKIDGQGCVGRAINWLSPQSSPKMIPPRSAGACKSKLMTMLQDEHGKAKLSREEYEKIAAWIDLAVPFCGDYLQANTWDDGDWRHHTYFAGRRRAQELFEAANVQAFVARAESPSPKASPGGPEFAENVALNLAARHEGGPYPRVTASTECRNQECFRGHNVINGRTENRGHGPRFPSWGPDQEASPWIQLDFGGPVEVHKVVLCLRADFPHDGYWKTGVIEFSDGSTVPVELKKTGEGQACTFPARRTTSIKLRDLKWADENTWCALTEFEVWGRRIGY